MKLKLFILLTTFSSSLLTQNILSPSPADLNRIKYYKENQTHPFIRSEEPTLVDFFCPNVCNNINLGILIGGEITNCSEVAQTVTANIKSESAFFFFQSLGDFPLTDMGGSVYQGMMNIQPGQSVLFAIQLGANIGTHQLEILVSHGDNEFIQNCTTEIRNNFATDLEISKTASDINPILGDEITYTVTVRNNGDQPAETPDIFEFIPEGLEFLSWDCPGQTVEASTGRGCRIEENLDPGESLTIEVIAKVVQVGEVVNRATVSTCSFDENQDNNIVEETIIVEELPLSADLKVIKTNSNSHGHIGEDSQYKILVINCGDSMATGIKLMDTLPNSFSEPKNLKTMFHPNFTSSGTCVYNDNHVITCDLSDMHKGDTIQVSYGIEFKFPDSNAINKVSVTSSTPDPDLSNNVAISEAVVYGFSDVSILKEFAKDSINITDSVLVTLKYTNHGPDPVTSIVLEDLLDPCFEFVSGDTILCNFNNSTFTCSGLDLNPGQSWQANFYVKANEFGKKFNSASITHDGIDENLENNISMDSIIIIDNRADVSIRKSIIPSDFVETGVPFTYRLIISNNGPQTAKNIMVNDYFSNRNIKINSIPEGCSSEGNQGPITCLIPFLESGDEKFIEINATTITKINVTNHAEIMSSFPEDPNPTNNFDSVRTHVIGSEETVENFPESGVAIDPISTLNGELIVDVRPIVFSTSYDAVDLSFHYRSFDNNTTTKMYPWNNNFDIYMEFGEPYVEIIFPTGRVYSFKELGDGTYTGINSFGASLIKLENEFKFQKRHSQYTFNESGILRKIEDLLNNNYIDLNYVEDNLKEVLYNQKPTYQFMYEGEKLIKVEGDFGSLDLFYTPDGRFAGYTDNLENKIEFEYLQDSHLMTKKFVNNQIEYVNEYDDSKRVIAQTVNGSKNSIDYEVVGVTIIKDENGGSFTHKHLDGKLVEINGINNNSPITKSYDENKVVITQGNKNTYIEYNEYDQPIKFKEGNYEAGLTYGQYVNNNSTLSLPDQFNLNGDVWDFQRDGTGRRTGITNTSGHSWIYTYPEENHVLITDPLLNDYALIYNQQGQIENLESAEKIENFIYDNQNRVIEFSDSKGPKSSFTYDDPNNSIKIEENFDKTVDIKYDENHNIIEYAESSGQKTNVLTAEYNELDRLVNLNYNGKSTTAAYDSEGGLESITKPNGEFTLFRLNEFNQIALITKPDGNNTRYFYNDDGTLSNIELNNQEILSVKRLENDQHFEIKGGPEVFILSPDYESNSMRIETPRYNVDLGSSNGGTTKTTFIGNILLTQENLHNGLPLTYNYGEGAKTMYNYDGMRVNSIVDPRGIRTTMQYDLNGNVVRVLKGAQETKYEYNTAGDIIKRIDHNNAELIYEYDDLSRVIKSRDVVLEYDLHNNVVRSNEYSITYDNLNRISSIDYGLDKIVIYSYDAQGVRTIEDWLGNKTFFEYEANNISKMNRANNTSSSYWYDLNGNPEMLIEKGNFGERKINLANDSKQVTAPFTIPLPPVTEIANRFYNNGNEQDGFSYDLPGNITNTRISEFEYNAFNLPEKVIFPGDELNISYDGFGQPIKLQNFMQNKSVLLNYAFPKPKVMKEEYDDGFFQNFVYSPDGSLLYSIGSDNSYKFYHFDELGNTDFITDMNGEIIFNYFYTPYGIQLNDKNTIHNPFTYHGLKGAYELSQDLYLEDGILYDSKEQKNLNINKPLTSDPRNLNPYTIPEQNPRLETSVIEQKEQIDLYEFTKTINSWWQIGENINGTCGLNSWSELIFKNTDRIGFIEQHILEDAMTQRRLEKQAKTKVGKKVQAAKFKRTMGKLNKINNAFDKIGKVSSAVSSVTLISDAYTSIQKVKERFTCYEEANYLEYLLHLLEALKVYKTGSITYFAYLELVDQITEKYAWYFTYSGELAYQEIKYAAIESVMDVVSDVIPLPEQLGLKKNILKALFGQESFVIK